MKKTFVIILVLVLVLAMIPTVALADGETINISNAAQLESAITNQQPGQTWNIAAGTYDIGRNSSISAGGQKNWYLPIVSNNITIIGAGIDQTIITSSTVAAWGGPWASQDFVSVFGDNVTIQNLTLKPKLDSNKAIEVLGKNLTLRNLAIKDNTVVTHDSYLTQKGITADSQTDYWEGYVTGDPGDLFFNPQNSSKNIGSVTLDNVLFTQSTIYAPSSFVSAGSINIINGTTVDYRGAAYAGAFKVFPHDSLSVTGNGLNVFIDDSIGNIQTQVLDVVPAGSIVTLSAGKYGAFTIPSSVTVNVLNGAVLGGNIVNNGTLTIASGAAISGSITGNQPQSNTVVNAAVNPIYTIMIPASVNFGTLTKGTATVSEPFNVTASNVVIDDLAQISVTVNSGFVMNDKNGSGSVSLPYKLYSIKTGGSALSTGSIFATFPADGTQEGRVDVDTSGISKAGSYMGTMDFIISYK